MHDDLFIVIRRVVDLHTVLARGYGSNFIFIDVIGYKGNSD